jgi:hypothetical protein
VRDVVVQHVSTHANERSQAGVPQRVRRQAGAATCLAVDVIGLVLLNDDDVHALRERGVREDVHQRVGAARLAERRDLHLARRLS